MALTNELEIKRDREVVKNMFVQNIIKLSAAVHALSCAQAFCPISQWWKIAASGPVAL